MYLERRILSSIHQNDAYLDFSAIIGWKHLGTRRPWTSKPRRC